MKRTKYMMYIPNDWSESLESFIFNEVRPYMHYGYVADALDKKIEKGRYDSELAIDAFYHVVTEAAKLFKAKYTREHHVFTVTERFTCATELRNNFEWDRGMRRP